MSTIHTTQVHWKQVPHKECWVDLPHGSRIVGWGSDDSTWLVHYIAPDLTRPVQRIELCAFRSGETLTPYLNLGGYLHTSDTFGPFHWHLFRANTA